MPDDEQSLLACAGDPELSLGLADLCALGSAGRGCDGGSSGGGGVEPDSPPVRELVIIEKRWVRSVLAKRA